MSALLCDLHLCGGVTRAQALELGRILMTSAYTDFNTPEEYLGWLHDDEMVIEFLDVDKGEVEPQIWDFVEQSGLYAAWKWDVGEDHAAGVDVWDPFQKKAQRFWISQGLELTIPVSRTLDAAMLAHYHHFAQVHDKMKRAPFLIGKSAHDLMTKLQGLDADTRQFLTQGT